MAGEYDKSKYTKKERLKNFWYYNKLYFIFGALVILFVIVEVSKVTNQQGMAFNVQFFNVVSNTMTAEGLTDEGDAYMTEFGQSLGMDLEKNVIETQMYLGFDAFDDSNGETEYSIVQNIGAYIENGDLDMFVADASAFQYFAYWEALEDLRNVLPAEDIEKLEPYFYYVDQAVIDEIANYAIDDEEYNQPRPDPKDPSQMQDPVPVGIYLDEANADFYENFQIENGTGVMGVFQNSKHPELCRAFIDYVLE